MHHAGFREGGVSSYGRTCWLVLAASSICQNNYQKLRCILQTARRSVFLPGFDIPPLPARIFLKILREKLWNRCERRHKVLLFTTHSRALSLTAAALKQAKDVSSTCVCGHFKNLRVRNLSWAWLQPPGSTGATFALVPPEKRVAQLQPAETFSDEQISAGGRSNLNSDIFHYSIKFHSSLAKNLPSPKQS